MPADGILALRPSLDGYSAHPITGTLPEYIYAVYTQWASRACSQLSSGRSLFMPTASPLWDRGDRPWRRRSGRGDKQMGLLIEQQLVALSGRMRSRRRSGSIATNETIMTTAKIAR